MAIALIAMAAPAAHAEPQFTSEVEFKKTTLVGTQEKTKPNKFVMGNGLTMTCIEVSFHGFMIDGTEATLTPLFEGCKILGAEVTVTGFEPVEELEESASPCDVHLYITGLVDLQCKTGKDVEIDTPVCTVTILPQKGLKKMSFRQPPGEKDYILTWEITGAAYELIGGFSCQIVTGLEVGVVYEDGKYEGETTLRAKDAGTAEDVDLDLDE